MKINIEKVTNGKIYFSTAFGKANGAWKGLNDPVEKEYYVEFDVEGIYCYSDFIIGVNKEYKIKIIDGEIQITLLLLEYDDDGCATFKFGETIIEIETKYDERFLALKDAYVTLFVDNLNIYDENF